MPAHCSTLASQTCGVGKMSLMLTGPLLELRCATKAAQPVASYVRMRPPGELIHSPSWRANSPTTVWFTPVPAGAYMFCR